MCKVGQWHVGANAGVLDSDDVVNGPVFGIARDVVGSGLPPEADAPEKTAHCLALLSALSG